MAPDATATESVAQCEAMGSVDNGDIEEFVIALPCQDDAWVSTPLSDASPLTEWR